MTVTKNDLLAAGVVAAGLVAGLTGRMDGAWLVAGIVLVGAGSVWFGKGRWLLAGAAAIVGGWLITREALTDGRPGWMGVSGVVAAAAIAAGIGRAPQAAVEGRVTLACLAVTCGAVWACVPETDGPGRLGLVLAIGAGAAALANVTVLDGVVAAAAAVLLFAGLAGGQYRPTAVVGAVASFGLLLLAWVVPLARVGPLGARLPAVRIPRGLVFDGLLVVLHGLAASAASRIAGRGQDLSRAVVIAVVVEILLVVGLVVSRQERRPGA